MVEQRGKARFTPARAGNTQTRSIWLTVSGSSPARPADGRNTAFKAEMERPRRSPVEVLPDPRLNPRSRMLSLREAFRSGRGSRERPSVTQRGRGTPAEGDFEAGASWVCEVLGPGG